MSNCYHYKSAGNDNFDNCLHVCFFCPTRMCEKHSKTNVTTINTPKNIELLYDYLFQLNDLKPTCKCFAENLWQMFCL